MTTKKEAKPRRYVKPEIRKVKLDAEVLLVSGCKMATGAAKKGLFGCNGPGQTCKNKTSGS